MQEVFGRQAGSSCRLTVCAGYVKNIKTFHLKLDEQ